MLPTRIYRGQTSCHAVREPLRQMKGKRAGCDRILRIADMAPAGGLHLRHPLAVDKNIDKGLVCHPAGKPQAREPADGATARDRLVRQTSFAQRDWLANDDAQIGDSGLDDRRMVEARFVKRKRESETSIAYLGGGKR